MYITESWSIAIHLRVWRMCVPLMHSNYKEKNPTDMSIFWDNNKNYTSCLQFTVLIM